MILLAIGLEEIIQLLVLLVFFIGPAILKVLGSGKNANPQQPRPAQQPRPQQQRPQQPRPQQQRPQQQRPQQQRPQQPAGRPNNPADALDAEIEEFLKRASGRRTEQPARPARPQPVQAEVVEAVVLDDVYHGESVAEHVKRHISVDDVTENSADFGRSVAEEVIELNQHVHDVFDHKVGSLPKSRIGTTPLDPVSKDKPVTPADRIRKMLSDPHSVRDAIILQEILKRPNY